MRNKYPNPRCALCASALPRGVRVAFFAATDSEEPVLGDFCCVSHAFNTLDELAAYGPLPETLYLGVRVDRDDHDEDALAVVMAEIARRAVREAMVPEEAVDAPRTSVPASQLN